MSGDSELEAYLARCAARVERALDRYLPPEGAYPPVIHQAMRYTALGGGKRLRGALVLTAAEMWNAPAEPAELVAAAVEMIHAYSLIHDDLPAMDDDDLRRGRPTNHRVFGEAIAILAGDALLTHAFSLLASELGRFEQVGPRPALAVIGTLGKACGTEGLIGGQVVDITSEGRRDVDLGTVRYIHLHKTAALIQASVEAGAILAGASEEERARLGRYGQHLGLAFQIVDDLLDELGDAEEMGKRTRKDREATKATWPAVAGVEASWEAAREAIERCRAEAAGFGPAGRWLARIAEFVLVRRS